ncbi:MAG TPA: M17 family peptidase N-terminal domain-containing protein, partial [Steroidobacteraceae bacterium]|nr:M17 family peptidase N-terminal domain-containing protein [Steroidobacteraceae bacterium]
MEFFVTATTPSRQRTDCAIVGVFDKGVLTTAAEDLDRKLGGRIARLAKRGDVRGKFGDTLLLADVSGAACERVLLVGLGSKASFGRKQYRKAISTALTVLAKTGAKDAVNYLSLESVKEADSYALARAAVETVGNAQYRIPDHKTANKRAKFSLTRFGIAAESRGDRTAAERGVEHAQAIVAGMSLMRDLANQPANVCTPTYLAMAA